MNNCKKCSKEFLSKQARTNHEKWCNYGEIKIKKYFICEKCGHEIKRAIKTHVNSCTGKGPRSSIIRKYKGKNGGWNKNLKTSKEIIEKTRKKLIGKTHSSETRKKLSEMAKKNNFGGITKGGGKGHKGWYKGYWCDSSWELAYVIYNLDNNIKFERNKKGFEYLYKNKILKYYPDFKVGDDYIEIKGWKDNKTMCKIEQFNGNLIVLYKNDLLDVFEYVINTYGKDFIKLYGE